MTEIFSLYAIFNLDNKSYAQHKKSRTEQNRGIYGHSFLDCLSSSVVARLRRKRMTPSRVLGRWSPLEISIISPDLDGMYIPSKFRSVNSLYTIFPSSTTHPLKRVGL